MPSSRSSATWSRWDASSSAWSWTKPKSCSCAPKRGPSWRSWRRSMLKEIVQTTANLLRLATDVQQNREEIKETRKELRGVVEIVQRLQLTVEQVPEREQREREMFMLQVENLIL